MDEKKLERLYALLERLEEAGEKEMVIVLREAIFKIEMMN